MAISLEYELAEHLCNLQDLASQRFRKTTQYNLLREKLEQMENDCKINFPKGDFCYIDAWIEAIMDIYNEENSFLYEQAFRDCIGLLKLLKII